MATKGLNLVIGRLRRAALERNGGGLSDGALLEAYVKRRDESSFKALVHRHGGMVLGVCRRILRNEADAEDAFQATFLVLVRKAASVRPRGMVSNWLYGVAHNTALKARAMNHKRRIKEREAGLMSKPQVDAELWQQVQALVDRELSLLPEKYRVAIVLCDLEGKTIKEAASSLDWPQGTLATRLKRGRALLARRLSGHGLTLSMSALTAVLAQAAARASVPAHLFAATANVAHVFAGGSAAAIAALSPKVVLLANGMVKLMLLSKLKSVSAVLLVVAVLGFGAAACSFSSVAEHRPKNTAGSIPRGNASEQTVVVTSDAEGFIIELPLKAGDRVRVGSVLVRLGEAQEAINELASKKTRVDIAHAELQNAVASLTKAAKAAADAKQLLDDRWEEEVAIKEGRKRVAVHDLKVMRAHFTRHLLSSRMEGTVTHVFKKEGDRIKKGERLLEIKVGRLEIQSLEKRNGSSGKSGPRATAGADPLMQVLALQFDAKEFRLPNITVKEFNGLLNEKLQARGAKLRVLVDAKAFKNETPGGPSVYDHVLAFPAAETPRISVHFILRNVLNQLPVGAPKQISQGVVVEIGAAGEPTLVFRDGAIWITTKTAARASEQKSQTGR
jgi:RNA polymerase sigma factor (sigma-70 family)